MLYYNNVSRRGEGGSTVLTTLEEDRRGWIEQEGEISTREALANIRDSYKTYLRIERENEEHHAENERRKQERLRKINEENKNLEWPKPDRPFKVRKSSDYWKNGCLYCSYSYKPQTTHDYEVHIDIVLIARQNFR